MDRFRGIGTRDIYEGENSKASRAVLPGNLRALAGRKLDRLIAAATLNDMRAPPGNHLEKLKGDRAGEYSVRINAKYRICFVRTDEHGAMEIEIVEYH